MDIDKITLADGRVTLVVGARLQPATDRPRDHGLRSRGLKPRSHGAPPQDPTAANARGGSARCWPGLRPTGRRSASPTKKLCLTAFPTPHDRLLRDGDGLRRPSRPRSLVQRQPGRFTAFADDSTDGRDALQSASGRRSRATLRRTFVFQHGRAGISPHRCGNWLFLPPNCCMAVYSMVL